MSFRSLFAVALASLVAVPAAAATQARRSAAPARTAAPSEPSSAAGTLSVGGVVGAEVGDISGFMLRLDGEMPLTALSPEVSLSGVGSIGLSRLSKDIYGVSVSWTMFEIVPAARFRMELTPKVGLYGDAGLGLYYGLVKSDFGLLGTSISSSKTGFLMRFGVGGSYALNPKLKLGAEISLLPYFGKADTRNWTFGVGAMFAI